MAKLEAWVNKWVSNLASRSVVDTIFFVHYMYTGFQCMHIYHAARIVTAAMAGYGRLCMLSHVHTSYLYSIVVWTVSSKDAINQCTYNLIYYLMSFYIVRWRPLYWQFPVCYKAASVSWWRPLYWQFPVCYKAASVSSTLPARFSFSIDKVCVKNYSLYGKCKIKDGQIPKILLWLWFCDYSIFSTRECLNFYIPTVQSYV